MKPLRDLQKMLAKMQNQQQKNAKKRHHAEVGYSSKCKTCNHEKLEEIERMYSNGHTYKHIIETLDLEDISEMALSRHFNNHYPKSQAYKEKQRQLALTRLVHSLEQYPFLEQYFMQQDDEFIKKFTQSNGFCIDKMQLCPFIVPGKISSSQNIINATWNIAKKDMERTYNSNRNNVLINAQQDVLKCLQCKDMINEERLNLMELFISNEILDVEIANKELYCSWIQSSIDKNKFVNAMLQDKKDSMGSE